MCHITLEEEETNEQPEDQSIEEELDAMPFVQLGEEEANEIQKILTDAIIKFCAENFIPIETVHSPEFMQWIQRLVTIGAKYGPIDLKELFEDD